MKIPVTITNLQQLIEYLVEEHHDGVVYQMAKALGVSTSLAYQWKDGIVKRPSDASLAKLCAYYDLDLLAVLALTIPRPARPISGGGEPPPPPDHVPAVPLGVFCKVALLTYYYRLGLALAQPQFRPAFAC